PQSARVYDYWLGGKDNFPADRAMGDAIAEQLPTIRTQVRAQRAFLGRTVRFLAAEAGIHQFLDIGTGIPTTGNVHEVAQEANPAARVLYVDNAPIVLAHSRALIPGPPRAAPRPRRPLREGGVHPGRPARAGGDPGRPGGRQDARPHPAGRPGAHRDHAPPARPGRPPADRGHPGRRPGARQLPGAVPDDPGLRPGGHGRPGRGVGAGRDPQRAPDPGRHRALLRRAGAGRARPGPAGRLAARPRDRPGPLQRLRLRRGRPQALSGGPHAPTPMLGSMNSLVAMASGLRPAVGGWRWAVKIGPTMSIIRCTRAVSKLPRAWLICLSTP